ncbi:MAG: nitrilase-related carbon-nitrogen hydrolase [Vulcanimicrobiota bacterium]
MKVGYLQFAPVLWNRDYNVSKAIEMLEEVDFDLMVIPELFNTGYLFTKKEQLEKLGEDARTGPTTKRLIGLAKRKKAHIAAGILEKENDKFYNSAVLVNENGYVDTYRKIHLFFEEKLFFEPGNKPFKVYDIGKARIGIMICYDWIYPESMRIMALQKADIICHCANLVMPYCPGIMPGRCFDNRVFDITANRIGKDEVGDKSHTFIGKSQVVGPRGNVLNEAGPDVEEVFVMDINPEEARDKNINELNNLFADRRPEMYKPLLEKTVI